MGFVLHPRLTADTAVIVDWSLSRVLLMNDKRFPWIVLVPRRPNIVEIFADQVVAYHNYDKEKQYFDGPNFSNHLFDRRAKSRNVLRNYRVEDFKCHVASDAIIFTQATCGTLSDGSTIRIPVAVVWTVKDGRIVDVNSVGDYEQRAAFEQAFLDED